MRKMMMAACAAGVMLSGSAQAAVIWSGTVGPGDPPTISGQFDQALGTFILLTDGVIVGTPTATYDLTIENVFLQKDGQQFILPTDHIVGKSIWLATPWIFPIVGGYEFHMYGFNGTGKYGVAPMGTDTGFSIIQRTFTTKFDLAVEFAPESVGAHYELNALGNVPEPATWAMMIAGFGLVGSTLRSRRRALA